MKPILAGFVSVIPVTCVFILHITSALIKRIFTFTSMNIISPAVRLKTEDASCDSSAYRDPEFHVELFL